MECEKSGVDAGAPGRNAEMSADRRGSALPDSGSNTYYLDEYAENAYSREDYDSFSFQDGLILKNARTLDEGDCIEDADGEIYLTGREFYKKTGIWECWRRITVRSILLIVFQTMLWW